jgi:hypothetical protein
MGIDFFHGIHGCLTILRERLAQQWGSFVHSIVLISSTLAGHPAPHGACPVTGRANTATSVHGNLAYE